jgi:hypothetical protein
MEKIYSKVEPDVLLHMVRRKSDFETQDQRFDIVDESEFIQCSSLKLKNGKTFRPHKHIEKKRTHEKQIAQESWIVIQGKVKCYFYDLDDKLIAEPILEVGDASFTLRGGHTYEILEDNTLVYEYKTGPYEGQALDKVFLYDEG